MKRWFRCGLMRAPSLQKNFFSAGDALLPLFISQEQERV
jgi:hypothetical protein